MEIETMKKMLGILDFAIVKEKAYMSNRFYNALIVYNMRERMIEKAERFIHLDASSLAYHRGCVAHNGNVYFYSDTYYGLHAYNAGSGCQKNYDLGIGPVIYLHFEEEKLLLFPCYAEHGLIAIDLEKETDSGKQDWWNADQILGDAKTNFLYSEAYEGSKVWSLCTKTNYLLISDCQMRSIKKHVVDIEETVIFRGEYDGNDFWFTIVDSDSIYQWNIEKGLQNCFKPDLAEWEETSKLSPYRKIVCAWGYVFAILCNENALFLLNKETGKLELLSSFPEKTIYPKAKDWGIKEKIEGNQLYLFCDLSNLIIQVDLESLNVRYIDTQVTDNEVFDEYVKQVWNDILWEMRDRNCWGENGYDWKTWLPNFIKFNMETGKKYEESFNAGSVGDKIYRKVVTSETFF